MDESDHWLLLIDLDGRLLRFRSQKVQGRELQQTPLPGRQLLVVENESCQHHLPPFEGTIAVLGTGFDVGWLGGPGPKGKRIGYWGESDTWGLQCLSLARAQRPDLQPLLMTERLYDGHQSDAVPEPCRPDRVPGQLATAEHRLYRRLCQEPRGRLEQELLPAELVRSVIMNWSVSQLEGSRSDR